MAWKYEDVKRYIEVESDTGYKLIGKIYEGIHKNMEMQCDKGHNFNMSFGNFKDHKNRCPECREIERKKKRFILFKSLLEENNYTILSTWEEYQNNKTKLTITCPKGHALEMSYGMFLQGNRCKTCQRKKLSEIQRIPLSEIEENIKNHGFKILKWLEPYKNRNSRFIIECSNDHIFETCYGNLLMSDFGCAECSGKKKHEGIDVYNEFIKLQLEPQFTPEDYKDAHQNLPCICSKHKDKGIQYKSFTNLKQGKGCKYCGFETIANKQRMDEDIVFNFMINKGMTPLEGEKYIDNQTHIYYICEHHKNKGIQTTTWMNLQDGKGCKYCGYDSIRGENHYNYKGGITPLTNKIRDSIMKSRWKYESSHKYNDKCVLSGLSFNLNIHHRNKNFSEILLEALNILNIQISKEIESYTDKEISDIKEKVLELHYNYGYGVPINKKLHNIYHKYYSKENNNAEEFEEFKQNYFKGLYNNELEEKLKSYNSIKRLKKLNIWDENYLKEAI